ncbi:MAG: CotH kinase family protein [Flavobacteriales bacterium]|nr:CotH kinase family protein [Flavobacteriales bacterium]
MKKIIFVVFSLASALKSFCQPNFPDPGPVYTTTEIPRVHINLDVDSLEELYLEENWYSNHEYPVQFVFESSTQQDTLQDVGFRFRGNTSRDKIKKSFKISFNSFVQGRKYFGFEKLNLNAEVNDPSMMRSRICWDLFRSMSIPAPRSNHVQVFINGEYFGLYLNTEHIDEEFCEARFGAQSGNLYKCRYPANLSYLGNNPDDYKVAPWGSRTYELKTNTQQDDYADLAEYVQFLNFSGNQEFECKAHEYFNVYAYLKVAAIDVLTGNWDGYIYNQNNFYLYHNPLSNQFEYIPYDLDNTWGIDWLDRNWSDRNIYTWSQTGQQRPLFNRLMGVDSFRDIFSYYVNDLLENFYYTEEHQESISSLQAFIEEFALADPYRPLDWGFDDEDFLNSLVENAGGHVDYGTLEFAGLRAESALNQLEPFAIAPIPTFVREDFSEFPNIFRVDLTIEGPNCQTAQLDYFIDGVSQQSQIISSPEDQISFEVELPQNFFDLSYNIILESSDGVNRSINCEPRKIYNSVQNHLVINELMSSNDIVVSDEENEFDDWVEIYNPSDASVDLEGYFLTDNLGSPTKWSFPAYSISSGEHLLVWCDRDLHQGDFHTNFKLSAGGEGIGLFRNENDGIRWVDATTFPALPSDFSYGREVDAQNPWILFSNSTPGASNSTQLSHKDIARQELKIYPNPTSDILHFNEVHHFCIISADGRIVQEGTGISTNVETLSEGFYFVKLENAFHGFVKN